MSRSAPLQPATTLTTESGPNTGLLLRKCSCGNNSSGGSCDECKEKDKDKEEGVHRKATAAHHSHDAPPIVHDVLQGEGRPLDAGTRTDMEQRFGHDFGRVRVHTDGQAAQSARAVQALAYTVGQHVVFGANQFSPATTQGRHLLAHELAHTVQQRGTPGRRQHRLIVRSSNSPEERAADRAADAAVSGGVVPRVTSASPSGALQRTEDAGTCDKDHSDAVNKAVVTAAAWLGAVSAWFDRHLALIKRRTPKGGDFRSVGDALFADLSLLDAHFKYSDVVLKHPWRGRFPDAPGWEGNFKDFETLARASYFIRKNFSRVALDLPFRCEQACPKGEQGADWVGSARAGSRQYTIYTDCFDKQDDAFKACTVLHEAFHASFDEFAGDSYSNSKDYPGFDAVSNADSYSTFASIIATGTSCRVQKVAETIVKASAEPEGP